MLAFVPDNHWRVAKTGQLLIDQNSTDTTIAVTEWVNALKFQVVIYTCDQKN